MNPRIRRLLMCAAVMGGLAVLVVLSPLLLPLALLADLISGPRRLRFTRILAMGASYLALETIGIAAAIGLWLVSGFGLFIGRPWSQRRHHLVQLWWTRNVLAAAERWLGAEVHVEGGEALATGNVIVCARHASFFDAVVPAVIIDRATRSSGSRVGLRHVLKQGLTFDPCLDIYGHRLPNHFVDRNPDDRGRELDAIVTLVTDLGSDAGIIFPEGTFHTPARAAREVERIRERDPGRADRAAELRHLLPVRPGGVLAMLDAAPGADLAFVAHTGFERFGSFRAILANVPFADPVAAAVWRVPAADVPAPAEDRLAFLDQWWQRMDDWITHHRNEPTVADETSNP